MFTRSGVKGLNDLKFGPCTGRSQNDGAARMAVKGLIEGIFDNFGFSAEGI